jgi:Tol biopolymer transport system component/Ca2+-binding RTX toxin-like protein
MAIKRVSVGATGGQGNGTSSTYTLSGDMTSTDGRYVVFYSAASNFGADTNGAGDIFLKDMLTGTLTRLSTTPSGSQGDGESGDPSISADGRYVAFYSSAANLVAGDSNAAEDIFVKDVITGSIVRASTTSAGAQISGPNFHPAIAPDGRFVAFHSQARLDPPDVNGTFDIFLKDLTTGAVTRVSGDLGGGTANSFSYQASVSAGGRFVAFYSNASNLVAGDTNAQYDVFVRDTVTGTTTRVSTSSAGAQTNLGNYSSDEASISPSGRHVVFQSTASNLVSGDTNGVYDIFLKDLQTGTTARVSQSLAFGQANQGSSRASVSDDGRYVVFQSLASNLVAGDTNTQSDIFVRDMVTGSVALVSTASGGGPSSGSADEASISGDGRLITFSSIGSDLVAGDTNGVGDVFQADNPLYIAPQAVTRISVSTQGVQGGAESDLYAPGGHAISADGRYVAFYSFASNLTPNDTNATYDVFLRDTLTGETRRVSTLNSGDQPNGGSQQPTLSLDGRYVLFYSAATNLVADDTNGTLDVFRKDMQTGDVTRLSTGAGGTQSNGTSYQIALSANSNTFAFLSNANNLVSGDTNGVNDIFLKDTVTGAVSRVSTAADGSQANGQSFQPTISADGRIVAFGSDAANLVADDTNGKSDVFIKNTTTGAIVRASTSSSGAQAFGDSGGAAISGDGRMIAFHSSAANLVSGDTNGTYDIFLKDLTTGVLTCISTDAAGNALTGNAFYPSISADGRYVAFQTGTSNFQDLVGGQLLVKDTLTGALRTLSVAPSGANANFSSQRAAISADGRAVAFMSYATDLVGNDTNSTFDVFYTLNPLAQPTAGNDILSGTDPGDTALVLTGADAIGLLAGDDAYDARGGDDWVSGGDGNDLINGGSGNDTLLGDAGSDKLIGDGGNDKLYGGDGTDLLVGGAGADAFDGGAGLDRVDYDNAVTLILGASGTAVAGSTGDAIGDTFSGIEHIRGSDQADVIDVSTAIGIVYGGAGDDTLIGGSGTNQINGDAGNDTIYGGGASGAIMAGDAGPRTYEVLFGGEGDDAIVTGTLAGQSAAAWGDAGDDRLTGGAGTEGLFGGDGSDTIATGGGNDRVYGGTGDDTITIGGDFASVEAYGGDGRDVLSAAGAGTAVRLYGDNDQDVLEGGSGGDVFYGGDGADRAYGGDGNDYIYDADGMSGDSVEGGHGFDSVIYSLGGTYDFSASNPLADIIAEDVELIQFQAQVTVVGSDRLERFNGSGAADTIDGGGGNDWIIGWAGSDVLRGGFGNDRLQGGAGTDTLDGGAGSDTYEGGADSDIFKFQVAWSHDSILDFEDGADRIDLGGAGITGIGQLTMFQQGSTAWVYSVANASTIQVLNTNIAQLTAADFVFA